MCFRRNPWHLSLSRYRVNFSARNDFPRYHPRATARRRSGSTDISRYGLAFHLPDKEFRSSRLVIVVLSLAQIGPACRHAVRTISSSRDRDVRRMASEDSDQFLPRLLMVHRLHDGGDFSYARRGSLDSDRAQLHASLELDEVIALARRAVY